MRVELAAPEDYVWFVERTGLPPTAWFRALKAVDDAGRIRGMVGYDGWTVNGCFMHMAIEEPIAIRCLVRPAFESLFVDSPYQVAMGLTRASLTRAVELSRRLGFREVYRIRDGYAPGEDFILSEMRREDCRWLKQERKAA